MDTAYQTRPHYALLGDCYGLMLTDRQRETWRLYYLEDWSLSEIAQWLGVSRAAVSEQLSRSREVLEGCEEKLGMAKMQLRRWEQWTELLSLVRTASRDDLLNTVRAWAREEGLDDV